MGGVRLKSANANLDGYIADAVLHVESEPTDLLQGVIRAGQKLAGLIPDLGSDLAALAGQLGVPTADLCLRAEAALRRRMRVRNKRNAELTGDGTPCGHPWF